MGAALIGLLLVLATPSLARGQEPDELRMQRLESAAALRSEGDWEAAGAAYRAARQRWPEAVDVLLEGAASFSFAGDWDESLAWYREAARLAPDSLGAVYGVARLLHWSGQLRASEQAYREALEVHPDHPELRDGLVRLLLELERRREALALLGEAEDGAASELRAAARGAPRIALRLRGGPVFSGAPSSGEPVSSGEPASGGATVRGQIGGGLSLFPGRGVRIDVDVSAQDGADPGLRQPGVLLSASLGLRRGTSSGFAGPWFRHSEAGLAFGLAAGGAVRPAEALTLSGYLRGGLDAERRGELLGSLTLTWQPRAGLAPGVGVIAGIGAAERVIGGQLRIDGAPLEQLRLAGVVTVGAQRLTPADPALAETALLLAGGFTIGWTPRWGEIGLSIEASGLRSPRLGLVPYLQLRL